MREAAAAAGRENRANRCGADEIFWRLSTETAKITKIAKDENNTPSERRTCEAEKSTVTHRVVEST